MNEHSPVLTTSLRADMDPATRRAYVQKWIARNQRRVSAGLGATVLTLPLLAQAQSAEGLVNVLDIAGVRSVALNADGSAQLTLGNGQQVQVAASSVQLAADGSVMISAAAAELVAEVVAGTAVSGAAGAGGGVGGAGIAAAVGGLGLAAAAAGGGGGSSANDSAPAIPVLNASAITPTSLQNVTAVFGSLPELGPEDSLFLKIGDGDEVKVTIGEDGSLNFPSAIDLAQFQGQQTLSYRVERTSTVEGEDDEGNPTSDTVTEDVASGSAVVFIDTIAPEITITTPIAGDDVINAAEKGEGIVIEGTAEGAENGQIVTLTLNGTEFTATVTDEAWSLPITAAELTALGLVSGDPVEITANVADAAGNPAEQDEATVGTDFIAEIRIDPVVIETLNTFIGVTVRGDTTGVEADQPITVTFNGQNIPGVVVQADGSWSANVPASVIKALDDGADITISASVSDLANNSDTSATTVTTDFSTPP
ncbi:MAG: Ig-like domain-containing protein, partial [Roseinatronobacter sp.]